VTISVCQTPIISLSFELHAPTFYVNVYVNSCLCCCICTVLTLNWYQNSRNIKVSCIACNLFIYSTKLELLRFSIVWVTSYKLFCVSTSRGSDLDRWAFGLKLQYNLHVHKYLCNNLNFLQLFVLEIRTYQECHMFLPPPPWTTGWNLCWRMQRQRYGRGPDAAAATGVPYVSFPVKTPRPMKNFHLWN